MFNWAKRSMKTKSFYTRKKKGQPDSTPTPSFPQSRKVSSESPLGDNTANTSENPKTTSTSIASGQENEISKTEILKNSNGGLLEEKSSAIGNHSENVVVPIMLNVNSKQAVNSTETFNKESNYTIKIDPEKTVYPKYLNPFGDETEGEETQSTLRVVGERTTEGEAGSSSEQNSKFCTRVPSEMVGKNPFDSESDSEDGGAAVNDRESRQADRDNEKGFAVNHSEATAVESKINSNCVNETDKSEQSCDIKIHITSPPVSGVTESQSSVSAYSEDRSLSRPNMKMGGSLPTTPISLRRDRIQPARSCNVFIRDVPLSQNMAPEKEPITSNQAEILPESLNPFDEDDDDEREKENKGNCADGPVTLTPNCTPNESEYICGFQGKLQLEEKFQAQQSTDTILTSSSGVSSLSMNNPFENDDDISVIEDIPQITAVEVNGNINNKFLPQKTSSPLPKARTSYSSSKVILPKPLPRKSRQSHHGSVSSVLSPSASQAGFLHHTLQTRASSSAPSINSNTVSRSQSATVLCDPNPTTQSNKAISKNPFEEDEDSNPEENMPALHRGTAGRSSVSNIDSTSQSSVSNAGSKQHGVTGGFQRFGLRASLPPSMMNFKKKKRHAPLPPTNQQQNSSGERPAGTSISKIQNYSAQELSYGKNYNSPHTIKKKPPPRPPPPRLNATS